MKRAFTLIELIVVLAVVIILGVTIYQGATGNLGTGSSGVGYGNYEVEIEGHRMIKNWDTQMVTHHPACTFGKCDR